MLDILESKALTLLDPMLWDDKNDSYFIQLYKEIKKHKSILAMCFTTKKETYHHWKVFADTISGVCIVFKTAELLKSLEKSNVIPRMVKYRYIHEARHEISSIEDLPFLKRKQYKDEKEYRIMHVCRDQQIQEKKLDINIKSIAEIRCSPWMPDTIYISIQALVQRVYGIDMLKTTLIDNQSWKAVGRNIVAGKTISTSKDNASTES